MVTHDHDLLDRFDRVIDFESFQSSERAQQEAHA
jgi:ABC-type lipoprotein export system ATPase subunit